MKVFITGTMSLEKLGDLVSRLAYINHQAVYLTETTNLSKLTFRRERLRVLLDCDFLLSIENPTGKDRDMYEFEEAVAGHLGIPIWTINDLNRLVADIAVLSKEDET